MDFLSNTQQFNDLVRHIGMTSQHGHWVLPAHPKIDAIGQDSFYFGHKDSNRDGGRTGQVATAR